MSSRNNSLAVKDDGADAEEEPERNNKSNNVGRRCFFGGFACLFLYYICAPFGIDGNRHPSFELPFLFLAAFLALGLCLAAAKLCGNESEYDQDFDAIVSQVAKKVYEEEETTTMVGDLEQPLLQARSAPPDNRIYQIEDRQFGITDKKSGEVFVTGTNFPTTQRLTFAKSGRGFSILGSRTTKSGNFVIQKGYVSKATQRAYWEETCLGIRRVVTGQFEDNFRSFSGEWLASDGSRGSLVSTKDAGIDSTVPLEGSVPRTA